ncbi:response regulator transcription factor [Micromonospora sp. NPDC001898]|uniref:response regulator transcription factor n=1 Tax=Micromonospora sp. NPDC001898 TaxID=3364221 RepID=UPI0036C51FAF
MSTAVDTQQLATVPAPTAGPAPADITPTDLRALALVAEGRSMRQIGRQLGCTPGAVQTRLWRLRQRIDARSPAHAVAIAYRTGLLPITDMQAGRTTTGTREEQA